MVVCDEPCPGMSKQIMKNESSSYACNLLLLTIATWNVWGIAPPSNAKSEEIRSERELKR